MHQAPRKTPDFPDNTDLIVRYGAPFVSQGRNASKISINPLFFAAKMQAENDVVFYKDMEADGCGQWNGTRWERIAKAAILRKIEALLLSEMASLDIALQDKVDLLVPRVFSILQQHNHNSSIPALSPDLIPVRNGILYWDVDARDFQFRDYKREDIIFDTLDAEYIDGCTSTLFNRKILEILPNADDRRVVQEYMGASLFSVNRTRKFLLLQGEGGCGKSLLVSLLSRILTYRRVFDLNFDSLKANYEFSALDGQTLLTASEAVSQAFYQSAGVEFVKKTVGGDFFQTRRKFKNERVDHFGFFSLIIVSNNSLCFRYDGRGDEFRDRLLPIRFTKHVDPEKQDKELVEKLLQERSAILNWLLEGARRIRRNNWQIKLSPEQISRRDKLIDASKGIDLFVRNHVVLSAGHSFTTAEAYKAYSRLQQDEGFEYLEETTFAKRLAKAMSVIHHTTATNTLKGGKARGYSGFTLA